MWVGASFAGRILNQAPYGREGPYMMTNKKMGLLRRWACMVAGVGVLLQVGTCNPTALLNFVGPQQTANVLSDTVFFLVDNLLVRVGT